MNPFRSVSLDAVDPPLCALGPAIKPQPTPEPEPGLVCLKFYEDNSILWQLPDGKLMLSVDVGEAKDEPVKEPKPAPDLTIKPVKDRPFVYAGSATGRISSHSPSYADIEMRVLALLADHEKQRLDKLLREAMGQRNDFSGYFSDLEPAPEGAHFRLRA